MQFLDGRLIVSPSDLTGFLECEHLTQQELAAARGEIQRPERKDPELEVLTKRGLEHEARHLVELRTSRKKVIEFPFPDGSISALTQAHEQTVAAMRDGVDVIYQGTFFDGRWRCHPDFLLRIVCRDIKAYEAFFLDHLSRFPGVQSVNSSIALAVIKETTALPLTSTFAWSSNTGTR